MTQIARSRQPGAAASAFMARLTATQATFRVRARMARLACSARAMPSVAKMTAPTSGIAASSAAIRGVFLTWRTMTYWASQLTAAAAAARTVRLHIALRSHPRARSPPPRIGPVTAAGAMLVPLAADWSVMVLAGGAAGAWSLAGCAARPAGGVVSGGHGAP